MPSDAELLRQYVESGSQEAFGELVRRHLSLVYHSALRRVGRNAHAADDVTQAVFTGLARKARTLQHHPNLAGWLYTATRFAAADSVRAERRRRTHEQEAETMKELNSEPPVPSERLEPFLDEALDLMDQRDREAVLLHYFEGHTFAEVGAALSLSADAARMRVSRALERLRAEFARRGVVSSAAVVAAALTAQTTMAVTGPSALAVAGRAISQAGAAQAASWGARILGGAKVAFSGWIPAVLILGAGALGGAWIGLREMVWKAPETGWAPADLGIEESEISALDPAAAERAAATTAPQGDFNDLSTAEKNVLRKLWQIRVDDGPRSGFVRDPRFSDSADFKQGGGLLVAKGFVIVGPKGGLRLTPVGAAFCDESRAALEPYPLAFTDEGADFAALPPSERRLLKQLWVRQQARDPLLRARVALAPSPNSDRGALFTEGRDLLLKRQWAAEAPSGIGVHLTDAGMAYCRAHRAEIEALASPL